MPLWKAFDTTELYAAAANTNRIRAAVNAVFQLLCFSYPHNFTTYVRTFDVLLQPMAFLTIDKALANKVKVKRAGVVFKLRLHRNAAACSLLLQLLRELPYVAVRCLQPRRGYLQRRKHTVKQSSASHTTSSFQDTNEFTWNGSNGVMLW
jgi:hypothetical protein